MDLGMMPRSSYRSGPPVIVNVLPYSDSRDEKRVNVRIDALNIAGDVAFIWDRFATSPPLTLPV
jgi:hypothetical protein